MAYALAKENERFISRMIRQGRFNNQSEVVREALRRMEREEASYLNPPPMSDEDAQRIYRADPEADEREASLARAALQSIRKAARK